MRKPKQWEIGKIVKTPRSDAKSLKNLIQEQLLAPIKEEKRDLTTKKIIVKKISLSRNQNLTIFKDPNTFGGITFETPTKSKPINHEKYN